MEILDIAVRKRDIRSILEKHLHTTDIIVERVNPLFAPVYFIEIETKIKRAFGLAPRVLNHNFLVNASTAELFRVPSCPGMSTAHPPMRLLAPGLLDPARAERSALQVSLRHTTRYYKFFWRPEMKVVNTKNLYVLMWAVDMGGPQKPENLLVNAYSGQVSVTPAAFLQAAE